MKKALRDILLIVVLFGAIVATPLVMQLLPSKNAPSASKSAPEKPATETVSRAGKVTMDGMPPQPVPSDGSGSAMDEVRSIDNADNAVPPPPADDSGGGSTTVPANNAAPEPTLMGDKDCPAIDLGAKHNYDPFAELRKTQNSFVFDSRATENMSITGGGFDLLKDTDGGDIHMDGVKITGIGAFDIRNDAPNNLHLSAAALTNIKGRHAIVTGDKQDIVYLDPCLEWNDPIAIEDGPEPLLRYDAHDKEGNQASVSVTEGVKVVKPATAK